MDERVGVSVSDLAPRRDGSGLNRRVELGLRPLYGNRQDEGNHPGHALRLRMQCDATTNQRTNRGGWPAWRRGANRCKRVGSALLESECVVAVGLDGRGSFEQRASVKRRRLKTLKNCSGVLAVENYAEVLDEMR